MPSTMSWTCVTAFSEIGDDNAQRAGADDLALDHTGVERLRRGCGTRLCRDGLLDNLLDLDHHLAHDLDRAPL